MTILVNDFVIVLLIFLRIVSAFAAAPIFGDKAIPAIVKIFLAFTIAYIIFLVLDTSAVKVQIELWWLFVNCAKEVITGLLIGYSLNLVFYGFSYAGVLIGFDMGLSMAQVLNPSDQTETNILGQFIYFIAVLIFFLINGHHYLIRGLAYSFQSVPIGKFTVNKSVLNLLIVYSANVFIIAVKIAAPFPRFIFYGKYCGGNNCKGNSPDADILCNPAIKTGSRFSTSDLLCPIVNFYYKESLKDVRGRSLFTYKSNGGLRCRKLTARKKPNKPRKKN